MFRVIEPKYLMLNGKFAFPKLTYENFLVDVVNASEYFREKRPLTERYKLIADQSHGECDIYSSTYQMDFKLLVDEEVMRIRSRNMPEIDYSRMAEGFVFTKSKEMVDELPTDKILYNICESTLDDFRNGRCNNNSIKGLIKNLQKRKNLFLYYPYEYEGVTNAMMKDFEQAITAIFKNAFMFRDESVGGQDTFVCFKINQYFVITGWENKALSIKDTVDEILCTNYRDLKTYSVY